MVAEARGAKWLRLCKICRQADPVDERSRRISHGRGGGVQDVPQSLGAAGRDDEDAESVVGKILQGVIEAELLLPTLGVLLRPYSLGAGVDFGEEAILLALVDESE